MYEILQVVIPVTIGLFLVSLLLWNAFSKYPIFLYGSGAFNVGRNFSATYKDLPHNDEPAKELSTKEKQKAFLYRALFIGFWVIVFVVEQILYKSAIENL